MKVGDKINWKGTDGIVVHIDKESMTIVFVDGNNQRYAVPSFECKKQEDKP